MTEKFQANRLHVLLSPHVMLKMKFHRLLRMPIMSSQIRSVGRSTTLSFVHVDTSTPLPHQEVLHPTRALTPELVHHSLSSLPIQRPPQLSSSNSSPSSHRLVNVHNNHHHHPLRIDLPLKPEGLRKSLFVLMPNMYLGMFSRNFFDPKWSGGYHGGPTFVQ